MTLPNLILGGAPKCATSSVFRWLADHPKASPSQPKETFYLMDRDNPLLNKTRNYHTHGLDGYHAFFEDADPSSKIIFEATTHYLYNETARKVLSQLETKPTIVFLLRNPAERVYSSFRYMKNNQAQMVPGVDFGEFVKILGNDDQRRLDEILYSHENVYVAKRDLQYSQYADYLRQWLQDFGTERIHVLFFENLVDDPSAFMIDFCERIGLDADFYRKYAFPRENSTIAVRHKRLHRWVRWAGSKVPSNPIKDTLKEIYFRVQSKDGSSAGDPSVPIALRELNERFEDSNRELQQLLDLQLPDWQ